MFEELDTEDYDRARDVYKAAIKLIPHKQFTFAKVDISLISVRLDSADAFLASFGQHMHCLRSDVWT